MSLESADAVTSMYPSYIFSFIMGFAPFKVQRTGTLVQITYWKAYQIISVLVYASLICPVVGMYYCQLKYFKTQSPMERFVSFMYNAIIVGMLTVNVIFNKVHTGAVLTLLRKIVRIDHLLRNKGMEPNYKRVMYSSLVFSMTAVTLNTSYVVFVASIQHYKDILLSTTVYFTFNIALFGFICVSVTFFTFFLLIGCMFEKILQRMEELVLKNFQLDTDMKCRIILETASLHQELCEISRTANDAISVQMLASFATTFGFVIMQIYSVITAFNNNTVDYNFVVSSIVIVAVLLEEKLILGVVSRRCMGMIPKTKQLLSKVLNLYINEYKICREVNAFNLQILHNQFEITAGNFFVIDLSMFITVSVLPRFKKLAIYVYAIYSINNQIVDSDAVTTTTTYIILFIQTDPLVDLYQSMKEAVGAL